jgi:RNase adapter protein RapZ
LDKLSVMERFVIVTGLSGAGKTTALQALEEFGFFTVDNLPPQLWQETLTLCQAREVMKLAVVTDARTRTFLETIPEFVKALELRPEIVYLDADDDVLIRRYGLTRRSHPIHASSLLGDIREERTVLEPFRAISSVVLDTSHYAAKDLVDELRKLFSSSAAFTLRLFSFGFKHGAPRDADLVLDVRGLPNPYWNEDLRPKSGLEADVRDHVFSSAGNAYYHDLKAFVTATLALAVHNGRSSYTIAIGCTGGRHRSVAVVEALAHDLSAFGTVLTDHRDIEKGEGGP